jgi:hypothetical protein
MVRGLRAPAACSSVTVGARTPRGRPRVPQRPRPSTASLSSGWRQVRDGVGQRTLRGPDADDARHRRQDLAVRVQTPAGRRLAGVVDRRRERRWQDPRQANRNAATSLDEVGQILIPPFPGSNPGAGVRRHFELRRHFRRLAAKSPVSGEGYRISRAKRREFGGESLLDEFSISEI